MEEAEARGGEREPGEIVRAREKRTRAVEDASARAIDAYFLP